jgi:solute carrier family 26 (sodium-independent sulfate anion transporter), member 11
MITPDRCLIFPSVDYVRNLINKQGLRNHIPIVIDCSFVYGTDFTASTVMKSLTSDFSQRKQPLFFYNLKPSVCAVFEGLDPVDFVVYYREEYLDELLKERSYDPKVLTV